MSLETFNVEANFLIYNRDYKTSYLPKQNNNLKSLPCLKLRLDNNVHG